MRHSVIIDNFLLLSHAHAHLVYKWTLIYWYFTCILLNTSSRDMPVTNKIIEKVSVVY
jgi:hypothetical protein